MPAPDSNPTSASNPTGVPPAPPTPPPAPTSAAGSSPSLAQVGNAASAVASDLSSDVTLARAEYDRLAPEVQAAIHKAYNDIEAMFQVSLAAAHTLYGAKK